MGPVQILEGVTSGRRFALPAFIFAGSSFSNARRSAMLCTSSRSSGVWSSPRRQVELIRQRRADSSAVSSPGRLAGKGPGQGQAESRTARLPARQASDDRVLTRSSFTFLWISRRFFTAAVGGYTFLHCADIRFLMSRIFFFGILTGHWFIYIVRCSDGSLFTGVTGDVDRASGTERGRRRHPTRAAVCPSFWRIRRNT